MGMFVVVAYASKCGSTSEVARRIGTDLRTQGCEVELADVTKLKRLPECDAVVLGTAIRMGRPLGAMSRFVQRNLAALQRLPVAVFGVGMTMREGTPESVAKAHSFVQPLADKCGACDVATFAGAVFPEKLPFPFSRAAADPDGALAAGDHRDWRSIASWASGLSTRLAAAGVAA
jgi:menaquinone-dependent protoporphyrinogen oxidase